jgi:hypothetical protein
MDELKRSSSLLLWMGDIGAYGVVTLIGFLSHGTIQSVQPVRVLATFLPFYVSWIVFALWGGVFYSPGTTPWRWVLFSGIAAGLSAPLGATLRGFWLGSPVLPIFVLVMAGVSALGVMLWRLAYLRVIRPSPGE